MQAMWFLETTAESHLSTLDLSHDESSTGVGSKEEFTMKTTKRDWLFRVQVPGLQKNEFVYVVGNLPELGAWNHNQAMLLPQERGNLSPNIFDTNGSGGDMFTDDGQDVASTRLSDDDDDTPHELRYMLKCLRFRGGRIFSRSISLPTDVDIEFRYFIAVVCDSNGTKNSARTLVIRKWETHMTPRFIKKSTPSNALESIPDPDKFGYHNGYCKVERGWLTDETVIQFKLFDNPIKIWKNRLQNRNLFIKMTPVNLVRHNSLELPHAGDGIDDSLSMDTQDITDQPAFSITEIGVMNDEEASFKYQEQFGREFAEDEFIIFNVAVRYPETMAYLVDFYVYGSKSFPGESPPNHIGFSYLLPSTLQASVGQLTVPITSTKHRPIGQLTIEFVVIKPILDHPWDMSISYAKHWEQRWSGLDVGHRGLGTSFKCEMKNCANVRENTIASLKTASAHGADMVEFDVQLSKDMIPVIYHDFHVSISLKRKKQIDAMDMLEIPVKDLTLEQLHLLKDFCYPEDSMGKVLYYNDRDVEHQLGNQSVYHLAEGREKNPRFFDEDLEDHQPFPTLQAALQELETHVGCNIEIKWNMQLKDGTFELNHPFDLNMYLDIILKVVLEYGGDRKIVFSSFNPDICLMIRLKQNKYPVVFLTQGITAKYPTYHDPRCQTIAMAMRHAINSDILGINVHTEDILRDPTQVKIVKDAGLIIFCWGDDNNDKATIQHLKKLGLHGVIYDKIDEYNAKEVKESIFLVDARENQKALIALAHCNQTPAMPGPIQSTEKDFYLDLEKSKKQKTSASTATSLASLSMNSVGGDSFFPVHKQHVPTTPERRAQQEAEEICDLAKDFSVCANSLGHNSTKASASFPDFGAHDESAKDGL